MQKEAGSFRRIIMTNNFTAELGIYRKGIEAQLKKIQKQDFSHRFWNKDKTLWNVRYQVPMGWLDVAEKMSGVLPGIEKFSREILSSEFKSIVLLGIGGSSIAPMVFQKMPRKQGFPAFFILDTSDPGMIRKTENEIDIASTLFVVSSKSGCTVEVLALFHYFFDKVSDIMHNKAGENFVAITDADSPLSEVAKNKNFRETFINFPDIGGRFSALSYFGMVPAALMGIDIKEFISRAQSMMRKCSAEIPAAENPGILLGVILAGLAAKGCDKLTYLLPPGLSAFGLWLEQLLAESTGKEGKGIFPLNGLPLAQPCTYGKDRFFFKMNFTGEEDNIGDKNLEDMIMKKYNPVLNITINDHHDMAGEFFRWEVATATAGAMMGINPFDQPNVEESKIYTEMFLRRIEREGKLPDMEPALKEDSLTYYGPEKMENSKLLIEKFFSTTEPGSYICLLAYLPEEPEVKKKLSEIEDLLQECFHLPVSVQFGPRYLHSTGQYHKGGPKNGYFMQFICHVSNDISIPGRPYTFGQLKNAQAIGDMEALLKHERKIVLVDIVTDCITGLNSVRQVIEKISNATLII